MTKEHIWLGMLTVLLGLTLAGGAVAVAALQADLNLLERQIVGGDANNATNWSQQPTPQPDGQPAGRIDALVITSDTLSVTLSVRFSGPADLLFEPPVLRGEQGTYSPTQDSLGQARFDFLNLVNSGHTQTTFVFRPAPVAGERLTLVFNPNHQPRDPVAPRWELEIRDGR
jgi:hypothetical protein